MRWPWRKQRRPTLRGPTRPVRAGSRQVVAIIGGHRNHSRKALNSGLRLQVMKLSAPRPPKCGSKVAAALVVCRAAIRTCRIRGRCEDHAAGQTPTTAVKDSGQPVTGHGQSHSQIRPPFRVFIHHQSVLKGRAAEACRIANIKGVFAEDGAPIEMRNRTGND